MTIAYYDLVLQLQHIAKNYGRQAPELLVVSKNQPISEIIPLLTLGHRFFGENRVQEALQKWPLLKDQYPDIKLHLIGPLQTNKVRLALELFDGIESLDRPKLAETLAHHWPNTKSKKLLIQINTGLEPQKSGVTVRDFPNLYRLCHEELCLPVTGLMCIPPQNQDPMPHFQLLATLARDYQLPDLSMGMSQDYPQAIACGASWVRIGTALFGQR